MLEQALTAVAAAGGLAVVQAAGTDVWTGLRQAVARWFGRGEPQREQAELERLDQTAGELEAADADADPAEAERARIRQVAAWQARIETRLEDLGDTERAQAAEELRALLARHTPQGETSAGQGGLAVGGNVNIRAEKGAIAAGVINGGARISNPPVPDSSQG
ncbi:hypothetical protein [Streptomyces sp. NPDC002054]|uniref:hypothetical protein n=1 Tax=Streptomyces sp. NPDC002054 TaxID=3154663 RepID=UPI003327EB48